ncbi:NPCBM/NEW2 domain-containing protein [Catenuloplanes sp. NPDC051500]|uniref:NPCBM/NEW2 domain-containing protein n=1 Tax=Catenuloplanes sp. NPDC051500 TaxID=3363959 RepID=UPI0037A9A22A
MASDNTAGGPDKAPNWVVRVMTGVGVTAALAVLGLVADLLGIVTFATGKSGPQLVAPAPSTAASAPASADPPAPSLTTGTPTAIGGSALEGPEPNVDTEPETAYLTDLELLNRASDVSVDEVDIGGDSYGHSVVYRCSTFCNTPKGVVEVNLGRRYTQFEATVGVLDDADDSDQVGYFEIFVDGASVKTVSATLGKPQSIKLELPSDAVRLKLLAYRTDTVENPLLAGANVAGGRSNGLPELAWGNPRLSN